MKRIKINTITRYFNIQKIAALFLILLMFTAYSVTFKDNNPVEFQKQKLINLVKEQQENGVSTLAITSFSFWLSIRDRLTNNDE